MSGGPVCFLQSETIVQTKRRQFIAFTRRNFNEFLEPLYQPWPGVSPTAILNEEKALGTRLVLRPLIRFRRCFAITRSGHNSKVARQLYSFTHYNL